MFGIAPDPAAIATLGLVAMAQSQAVWPLLAVPVLWCLVSAITLYAMGAPEAVIPIAAVALAITARTFGRA